MDIRPDIKESLRHSAVNGSSLNSSDDSHPRRSSSSSSGVPPSKPARPSTLPGPPGGINKNLKPDMDIKDILPSTPTVYKVLFFLPRNSNITRDVCLNA